MEPDPRQSLANAWPVIAVVLIVSGILVRTVPLESKRPIDPNRVGFYHAGRQDVEARLWQDPFVAMQHITSRGPIARCKEAIDDWAHHPSMLRGSVAYKKGRSKVRVLPVMVPGGPYFEDGEARRRSRYAVLTALLNSDWRPTDEDKLGYVWTFQSCVKEHWERRVPELLPYEWFIHEDTPQNTPQDTARRALLVLWVDEDAITRRPSLGIERIIRGLNRGDAPCPFFGDNDSHPRFYDYDKDLLKKIHKLCGMPKVNLDRSGKPLPFDDIPVIGPSTSSSLIGLARELAENLELEIVRNLVGERSPTNYNRPRFYSSGATASVCDIAPQSSSSSAAASMCDPDLRKQLWEPWTNYIGDIDLHITRSDFEEKIGNSFQAAHKKAMGGVDLQKIAKSFKKQVNAEKAELNEQLKESFNKRLIRLTATDDQLVKALMQELERRLADATPLSRISRLGYTRKPLLSDDTVVLISERDTIYARAFLKLFEERPSKKDALDGISAKIQPRIYPVHYLRGLDGAPPQGTGTSTPSASPPDNQARTTMDVVFEQPALERAEGQSQYDYLRRLATDLIDLDRDEKEAGRNGIRAVGVLGNDVYDKILILDALRDRFPKAVFFAADLDARLLGREVIRSTRNLIVASSYGLTLNPGIQRAAPPFRDMYQTGMYFSTLVALAPAEQQPSPADLNRWFDAPQLFEIGRSRAVPLSKGAEGDCAPQLFAIGRTPTVPLSRGAEGDCVPAPLKSLKNIHAIDEWAGFPFWSNRPFVITLLIVVVTGAVGLFTLFRPALTRYVVITGVVVVVIMLIAGIVVLTIIWPDIISGEGEPFAWFEGVSIWPTMSLKFLILLVTGFLLLAGRRRFTRNINSVEEEFGLTRRSESNQISASPWTDFFEQTQFWPTFRRVFMMTALFFVFGVALLNLDWPFSPHRGALSAWFNHALLLSLLACMTALLCAGLDASKRTRDYLAHLRPDAPPMPLGNEPSGQRFWAQYPDDEVAMRQWAQYPDGELAMRLWTRFRFAVRLASSVSWFIYLPFIPLLLVLPTRSRVLEAWNIPLPYIVLLSVWILLAVLGAFSLRRAAADLKTRILKKLDSQLEAVNRERDNQPGRSDVTRAPGGSPEQRAAADLKTRILKDFESNMEALNRELDNQSGRSDATRAPGASPEQRAAPSGQATSAVLVNVMSPGQEHEGTPAADDIPPQIRAGFLRQITAEIRSVQEGPFRPFTQEPVVRAILTVSAWLGGLSTVEFLFLR